jgi:hypothetical protein
MEMRKSKDLGAEIIEYGVLSFFLFGYLIVFGT